MYSAINLTAWNDSQANSFTSNFAGPVKYDVLTEYKSGALTAFTRQWNGSATSPAMVLHGDMIVNGTVTASKIVANALPQIGVNIIYDRAAALSSTQRIYK